MATTKFIKTLQAVREPGATQAAIGHALRADIHEEASGPAEDAAGVVDIFEECAALLHEQGYEFDADYLRQLYGAAVAKALDRYLRE